ncbi:S26 family signal peptidase [Natrarchaeobius chitinivorans]|uniref:S26 family signal peptidase n=1 Tax=Natrarchaeobius chitinivorans TaxID=1679083 RepID=A0A3N6LTW6_NATCH|nr:S26 family signal peptidase [Natrarchaeobius chitinivorans]RQG90944.1 S26 family signal peptidase [Natrarchaeobius chitinivorans]
MDGPRSGRPPDGNDDSSAGDGSSIDAPANRGRERSQVRDRLCRLLNADSGPALLVRDVLTVLAIVSVIGLVLFGVSGVWPPMVAIESPSMEPNANVGDMVFLVEEQRFAALSSVDGTGVATHESGLNGEHEQFGKPGDVIVFEPNGDERETPIIHRAHLWVEEGDDWVRMADPDYVGTTNCEIVSSCPAAHDGFITKGDANSHYDQRDPQGMTDVVKPEWIVGKGLIRVPWLGQVRLTLESVLVTGGVVTSLATVAGIATVSDRIRRDP